MTTSRFHHRLVHEGGYGVRVTDDAGLAITRETARCRWHGESMNYSQAIEAMQFLEQRAASPPPVS